VPNRYLFTVQKFQTKSFITFLVIPKKLTGGQSTRVQFQRF